MNDLGGSPICTEPVIKQELNQNELKQNSPSDLDITGSERTEIGDSRK